MGRTAGSLVFPQGSQDIGGVITVAGGCFNQCLARIENTGHSAGFMGIFNVSVAIFSEFLISFFSIISLVIKFKL